MSVSIDSNLIDQLRQKLDEVAALLPDSGGRVVFDDDSDVTLVLGDQLGFAQLGVGMAVAAMKPATGESNHDEVLDIGALDVLDHPEQPPVVFRRVRDWSIRDNPQTKKEQAKEAVALLACSAVICIVGFLIVLGALELYRWVFGG